MKLLRHTTWVLLAGVGLSGCVMDTALNANLYRTASVISAAETAPAPGGDGAAAVVVLATTPNGADRILAATERDGLELYDVMGARISAELGGDMIGVDVRYHIPFGGRDTTIVAAMDGEAGALRLYEAPPGGGLRDVGVGPIAIGFEAESMCLYRSALDGSLYVYVIGGAGEIEQQLIFDNGSGALDARLVRRLHVASEAAFCVADDASGDIYVAEQGVGVWRFDADPEAEIVPELIDAARLGRIAEETGGVAIYDAGPGANYLVVSNANADSFNVYDRDDDHRYVGSFNLVAGRGVDAVEEAGSLFATSVSVGDDFPRGVLLAADDENDGGVNFKIVDWRAIERALDLGFGAARDPRVPLTSDLAAVRARLETPPVETNGDAADDPAIWLHPTDLSQSLVIGTQKQSGLYVYDLQGVVVQFLADGRMNNVDVRDGFSLDGETVSIVAASNRTDDTIALYRVDATARRLVEVADGPQSTGFDDTYGLCMYRSPQDGTLYVFVTASVGPLRQWALEDAGGGKVSTRLVRDIPFESQTEGCVADDEAGVL